MRNWNYSNLPSPCGGAAFSAYLWGIETLWCFALCQLERVLSLPMRNWNPSRGGRQYTVTTVLSLPMRNWNDTVERHNIPNQLVLSLPMRNWNHICPRHSARAALVLSLPMRNWNDAAKKKEAPIKFVLSLPMRNWNDNLSVLSSRSGEFSAYLWGIETPACLLV